MSAFVRGNRDLIKAMNRNLLLNIIRQHRFITRKQLTDASGLSVGAVSQIVNELLNQGWLLEQDHDEDTGGRPRSILRLNPTAGYALGLKLMENRVVAAVTNFETDVLYYRDYNFDFDDNPNNLSRILASVIEITLAEARIDRDQLFGAGIGLAGVIYAQSGIVHHSPFFGWRDVPLAKLVQNRVELPIYVENDVNTLTITQQLFGAGYNRSHFIVVTVGRGIGMGMVINGQLYQGAFGGAGEIGHNILWHGTGQTLEDVAADPAVVQAVESAKTLADVIALANAGDSQACQVLADSGTAIGVSLANIVNTIGPELIILSGEGIAAGDYRLQPMMAALRQYTFNGLLDRVEVVVEPTDDRAWARGAASVVISKVFESPTVEARVHVFSPQPPGPLVPEGEGGESRI
ncbi:MAG: ROK family transcriptional regulator [bacterium]|nr:ROK family transcriptional regulator [bacterium]